ncbi:MAG TPA: alpha/beta hydrolase-fold protein [Polyangia bacterium]|nr:alpha/beta hydrolase-fold protein [Polyangia bacterium]
MSILLAAGCGGSDGTATEGTGGASASGGSSGTPATGGQPGAGGSSGGTIGTGGAVSGTGGASGSGGVSGSGGTTGAAGRGVTGTGGSQGSGGTRATSGAAGGNGTAGSGTGGSGTGGVAGGTGSGGTGASASSAGCGINTTPPSASAQQTMQVGGKTRYYLLYVPSGYSNTKPMPLIFVHHGLGGTNTWASMPPDSKDWYGRFALKEATNGAAIIAYPMGTTTNPGSPGTSEKLPSALGQSSWGSGDLPFFDALLEHIESSYCINKKRVFATGYSMGGMFSNMLACERSSVIRGIAPVAGWGPNGAPGGTSVSCATASKALGDIDTHGTKDGTVAFASGQASAAFWAKTNGCGTTLTTSSTYQNCQDYQGCPAGKEVHFCPWSGDHQVPSWAGANIWKFFSSLPDLP